MLDLDLDLDPHTTSNETQTTRSLCVTRKRRPSDHKVVMTCTICGPWSSHTRASHGSNIGTMFTQGVDNPSQIFARKVVNPLVVQTIKPKYVETKKLTSEEVLALLTAPPECPPIPWSQMSTKGKQNAGTVLSHLKFCPGLSSVQVGPDDQRGGNDPTAGTSSRCGDV